MAFCRYCGQELNDGAMFCRFCGKQLAEKPDAEASELSHPEPPSLEPPSLEPPHQEPPSQEPPHQEPPSQEPSRQEPSRPELPHSEEKRKTSNHIIIAVAAVAVILVLAAGGVFTVMKFGLLSPTVDVSDFYSVEVEGNSSEAVANVAVDDVKLNEVLEGKMDHAEEILDYISPILDKDNGLSNGDVVTLSFDIDADGIKKKYGIKASASEKEIVVEGLPDLLETLKTLSGQLDGVTKKVTELVKHDLNNQNELIPGAELKELLYAGCYLLKAPDGTMSLIPVYRVVGIYPYGNEMQTDSIVIENATETEVSYYTGIELYHVGINEGGLSFDGNDAGEDLFNPDVIVMKDGGYNYGDSGRLWYGFNGYETKEAFKNDISKIYPDVEITESIIQE